MFANSNRQELRQFYFDIWHKYQAQLVLEPLEQQILSIILQHPEYHSLLNDPEQHLPADYLPESAHGNPFLHLSLHQALLEQLTTDRPKGIQPIYAQLLQQTADPHLTAHNMMEVLAGILWETVQQQKPISEAVYLARLQALIR